MLLPERYARLLLALIILCGIMMAMTPAYAADTVAHPAKGATDSAGTSSAVSGTAAKDARLPTQYGIMAEYSYSFDPTPHLNSLLARFSAIFDYGSVWHQDADNTLRFKVEGALGSTLNPDANLIASANMLALKYPLGLDRTVRPYGEAGIGIIYTQYRVKGQGLHVNFNPVLGAGLELPQPDGRNLFGAIRLYHLSNANLDHDNRGLNYVAVQVGRLF